MQSRRYGGSGVVRCARKVVVSQIVSRRKIYPRHQSFGFVLTLVWSSVCLSPCLVEDLSQPHILSAASAHECPVPRESLRGDMTATNAKGAKDLRPLTTLFSSRGKPMVSFFPCFGLAQQLKGSSMVATKLCEARAMCFTCLDAMWRRFSFSSLHGHCL